MVSLQDSLVSSSARRLTIRKRPDLSAKKQSYLGQTYWVVKEPVGLKYYRFQEEEYALLGKLDGNTSLDELKEWFEAEFPPQKITLEELQQFLGMLHRSSLIIADVPGQGKQLRERRDTTRRKEVMGAFTNILCIRFKGFDPERLLKWLYPKVRVLFSLPVFIMSLILIFSALTLVLVQFDTFYAKLPSFYSFFSPTNALLLMVVLGATKVFHEFGHGLTCTHFGGECHEMGVLILVLTPCLYCNVSDSWMLPNKWHRAAIGAAGMYVECVIASLATFIWWYTQPGILNMLCLNVIFISSVSTILFNANPLLRYDGYYILSDIVEIPNLRQKASSIFSRKMGQWCLGIEPPEDPFLPQRNQAFFALYTVAASIYRWFVLFSILWFMHQIFKPYRLDIIGNAIIGMSLFGLVGMPLFKLYKFFNVPGRMQKVKKPRFYATLGLLALLVFGVLYIPLPHSVICTLEVRARDAEKVYAEVPGILEEVYVQAGDKVRADEPLARVQSMAVELALVELQGRFDQYKVQLDTARRQRFESKKASAEIEHLKVSLASVTDQIREKKTDEQRLLLKSPIAGTIMPPAWKPHKPGPEGQLAEWSGTALQKKNRGVPLDEGTLFCLVGNPNEMEAILYVDQGDLEFVTKGQKVEIVLDSMPFEIIESTIEDIAPSEVKVTPERLSTKAGGELATVTDEAGVERLQSAAYQAKVLLDDPDDRFRIGLRGRAKIATRDQTIGQRLKRLVDQVLNFKL
jgi:putative peptide zinc metalloprotease protein